MPISDQDLVHELRRRAERLEARPLADAPTEPFVRPSAEETLHDGGVGSQRLASTRSYPAAHSPSLDGSLDPPPVEDLRGLVSLALRSSARAIQQSSPPWGVYVAIYLTTFFAAVAAFATLALLWRTFAHA